MLHATVPNGVPALRLTILPVGGKGCVIKHRFSECWSGGLYISQVMVTLWLSLLFLDNKMLVVVVTASVELIIGYIKNYNLMLNFTVSVVASQYSSVLTTRLQNILIFWTTKGPILITYTLCTYYEMLLIYETPEIMSCIYLTS